ncbi:MAG: ATP-binding protein [bacterium]|nr:ATP-binding protein [bacterium]
MDYYSISTLIVLLAYFLLGTFVFFRNRYGNQNRAYAFVCLTTGIWAISDFLLALKLPIDKTLYLYIIKFLHIGTIFFPSAFARLSLSIFDESPKKYFRYFLNYFPLLLWVLTLFTPFMLNDLILEKTTSYSRYFPKPGILYNLVTLFTVWVICYWFYKLIYYYKRTTGLKKTQIKYFLLASSVGILAIIVVFLNLFGIEVPPIDNFISIGYLLIMTYAIVRHHLLDIHAIITKAATYFVLSILTALLFVPVLLAWEDYLFGGITNHNMVVFNWWISITVFLITLIVSLFYPKIIAKMQKKFKDIFFREKYDYKEVIDELNNAIVNVLDLHSLLKVIVEQLNRAFEVNKISIIALDQKKNNYKIFYSNGLEQELIDSFKIMPSDHFIDAMKDTKKIIIKEERERMLEEPVYQDAIKKYKESQKQDAEGQEEKEVENKREISGLSEKEWKRLNYWFIVKEMKMISAEISIPLFLHDKLVGIISMDMKGNKDAYSDEDLVLLNTLSTQAAVAIQNAQLIEMDTQRFQMVRHMDKLASLGLLVSGVAHEIRNPLGTIKTFFQLFPERCDNEEFKTDFYKLAMGEADRISRLVDEILGFSRKKGAKLVSENLNVFIEKIIIFVAMETKRKNVKFEKHYDVKIPMIMFDPEKMKQVFINFFMNAIEAMKKGGTLSVSTQKIDIKGKDYIRIDISDTGEGISEENLGNLFTPFFTTKDDGTGLGLSISHQIIADHNGMIEIKSQLNLGTTFYIYLPVEQPLSAQEEKPIPKLAGLKRVLDNPGVDFTKI